MGGEVWSDDNDNDNDNNNVMNVAMCVAMSAFKGSEPYPTLIGKNQRKTEKTAFCLSIDSKKLRKTISKELRFAPSFTDTMWFIMNYYIENCSMLYNCVFLLKAIFCSLNMLK